jgi:hypothetical protein
MKRSYPLCKKGLHRMTPDNTYRHPAKGPECRECKRAYMRGYMREVRAEAARRQKRRRRKRA